jgi:tetratricopeptide (TPR) repeat protein
MDRHENLRRCSAIVLATMLWGCATPQGNRDEAQRYFRIGMRQREAGNFVEAARGFAMAIQQDPSFAPAHMELGAEFLRSNVRLDDAIASFERALELDPTLWLAKHYWVDALRMSGDDAGALALQRELVEELPDRADQWNNLGHLLLKQGAFEDAVAAYRRSLAIDPRYAKARGGLGIALWRGGKPAEGAAELAQAIAAVPTDVSIRIEYAKALLAAGRPDDALAAAEAARELAPENGVVYHVLAEIAIERGDLAGARAHARDAVIRRCVLTRELQQDLEELDARQREGVLK